MFIDDKLGSFNQRIEQIHKLFKKMSDYSNKPYFI